MCDLIKYICLLMILIWYLKSSDVCSCQNLIYRLGMSLSKSDNFCETICDIPSPYDIIKANQLDKKLVKFFEEHYA